MMGEEKDGTETHLPRGSKQQKPEGHAPVRPRWTPETVPKVGSMDPPDGDPKYDANRLGRTRRSRT